MYESCPELQHDLGSLGFAGCYVGGCVGDQCLASNTSGGVWFVWKTSGILNVLVELAK